MVLNLALPATADFVINDNLITIKAFDASQSQQNLNGQPVNIIASGPSIADLALSLLQDIPTIFVNGSISLTGQHEFSQVVGYVISDARFINHQPEILQQYYKGQPLYATLAVFETMTITHPDIMCRYHKAMRILYPVNRPWGVKSNQSLLSKLSFKNNWLHKKKPLASFVGNEHFLIDAYHKPAAIGVSFDISHGFVEAGTVAYVATQLAFARDAEVIHLYGIDLLNNNQPRFYEKANNSAPSKLDKAINDRIVPSFNLLIDAYHKRGVPVINHSPISKDLFNTRGYSTH